MPERSFRLFVMLFLSILVIALAFLAGTPVDTAVASGKTLGLTEQPLVRRTKTPTPTPTLTVTKTGDPSITPSSTPTITPTPTLTLTRTKTIEPSITASATPTLTTTAQLFDPPSVYLTVNPAVVRQGGTFTLNFVYHNLGEPYTYIDVIPPELVDFDPAKIDPCRFGADPTYCTAITLRAKAKGTVNFSVWVSGEIWDGAYWRWGSASTGGTLTITDDPWPVFLPFMQQ